jgi:hypothetical protein
LSEYGGGGTCKEQGGVVFIVVAVAVDTILSFVIPRKKNGGKGARKF